jgi:hypothetical protein
VWKIREDEAPPLLRAVALCNEQLVINAPKTLQVLTAPASSSSRGNWSNTRKLPLSAVFTSIATLIQRNYSEFPWEPTTRCSALLEGSNVNSVALVRERTIPIERPLFCERSYCQRFADRRCRVNRATGPYGRIHGFIDRRRYNFFRAAPELYWRGWVYPVPDPLLLRKSGESNPDLWVCSPELWPLHHRGGLLSSTQPL